MGTHGCPQGGLVWLTLKDRLLIVGDPRFFQCPLINVRIFTSLQRNYDERFRTRLSIKAYFRCGAQDLISLTSILDKWGRRDNSWELKRIRNIAWSKELLLSFGLSLLGWLMENISWPVRGLMGSMINKLPYYGDKIKESRLHLR